MSRTINYPSINGLRAVSILLVVVHHLAFTNTWLQVYSFPKFMWPVVSFLQDGQMGVNVFFLISGFLITSLLLDEESKTKTISLKNFYLRRTLRIFPAYYFFLLILAVAQLANLIHLSSSSWLTSLTYTKYLNWQLDWVTSHAWSLSIEEQFYLFWPFVFLLGDRWRKFVAILLMVVPPVLRVYFHAHTTDSINDLIIFMRIDGIATGCLIAMHRDQLIGLLQKYWTFAVGGSVLGLVGMAYFQTITNALNISPVWLPLSQRYSTTANLMIGVILLYSVFGAKGWWFKFLNSKPMNFIGLLSYSIYLWQQVFTHPDAQWYGQLPINLILIFGTAIFSYYVIEKPFLSLKEKLSRPT